MPSILAILVVRVVKWVKRYRVFLGVMEMFSCLHNLCIY